VQRFDVSRLLAVDVDLAVADSTANAVLRVTELGAVVAEDSTPQRTTPLA